MLQEQAVSCTSEPKSRRTILVVEDNVEIGDMLVLALSQEPSYDPIIATTGKEVMNILTNTPVHLLLIDYDLADCGGLPLYDCLHTQAAFHHVPAIIISTSLKRHAQELAVRNLIGLGKPFHLDDLFETVKHVLR